VTDLCSIGTLFAFVLVCAGVLVLQNRPNVQRGKFRIPYANSKYIIPVVLVGLIIAGFTVFKTETTAFITNKPKAHDPITFITALNGTELNTVQDQIKTESKTATVQKSIDTEAYLNSLAPAQYNSFLERSTLAADKKFESGWSLFKHKIPMWIFFFICLTVTYFSVTKNLSLIPVLGLLSCLYMMCELGISNWIGFGIWLVIGLVVYFLYGFKHSKLNEKNIA